MLSSGSSLGAGALQSMTGSASSASYGNERPGAVVGGIEVEYASDPASGGFFHADYKKHDDLKQMLDSNKDSLKLEAMKRIIAMVAKGRDASDLFPAVVKNVVSKNIEVKKLVYVYLVRYAEEQQDLALLSISTFQRALKDPNQLIRAGALRVLSSIRVSMIVPIVMLAIRDSASDMSPYVRKTAAHAIPKLYSLDGEQKEELIGVIEKLLSDRTTLVVGSAVMAFEEVCPERVDLIHKNYRKLCNLLVDVDEWGQIIIINMLTRYARTQFVDPNRDDYESVDGAGADGADGGRPFYDETSSEEEDEDDDDDDDEQDTHADNGGANEKAPSKTSASTKSPKKVVYQLDADHRLLLRQTKPLLQSRNASVVMTVAQLYHHVAPRNEVDLVAKALIRLLRSHKEVQSVVLTSIASMSTQRKSIFELYIKSFFVRTSDATHIKLLKLEILTNLATATSISVILREFQTYISSNDREFVAATIQAIGRCAASIREVTETCLSGLVHLLSNRDEYVVAESVVVIKQLLQTQAADHFDIISQMAKLLDFIAVAAARAAILWLIGEYNEKVPRIAPDVLRKLAKTFVDEDNIVKLQVLNLAVKLYLTNAAQTELLCQYVFNLARYDPHYDVRDRARFLKQFIFPAAGQPTVLSRRAREIFLAAKPAPQLQSKYQGREQFQLGSLSHYLNMRANGYHDIPDFPDVAPDSSVRHVESPTVVVGGGSGASATISTGGGSTSAGSRSRDGVQTVGGLDNLSANSGAKKGKKTDKKQRSFYSESEKSSSSYGSSSSSSSSEESSEEEEDVADKKPSAKTTNSSATKATSSEASGTSDSEEDSSSSSSDESTTSGSSSSSGSDDDEDTSAAAATTAKTFAKAQSLATKIATVNGVEKPKSNLDLLLDLDDIAPVGPIMTPSLGGFLTPSTNSSMMAASGFGTASASRIEPIGPSYIPLARTELLSKLGGNGLAIACRFTRAPHLFSAQMVTVELEITNTLDRPLADVRLDVPPSASGSTTIKEFAPLASLTAGATVRPTIGIDFNDSTQPVSFAVQADAFGSVRVQLRPTVGDLMRSVAMSAAVFDEERAKLRGMNEHTAAVALGEEALRDRRALQQRVFEYANVAAVATAEANADGSDGGGRLLFAGQTMASRSLVLMVIEWSAGADGAELSVSCEKMMIGSMALTELRAWLTGGGGSV